MILTVFYWTQDEESFAVKLGRSFVIDSFGVKKSLTARYMLSLVSWIVVIDLNLKVYYLDKLVVRTTNNIDNKEKIYLINEVKNKFFHTFDLQVNSSTIELVYKIQNDLKYFINYELSFKILGLTINYKGKYENN